MKKPKVHRAVQGDGKSAHLPVPSCAAGYHAFLRGALAPVTWALSEVDCAHCLREMEFLGLRPRKREPSEPPAPKSRYARKPVV